MTGKVLIYGGSGALGATCVSHFKAKDWWVCCVDLRPNESADVNIVVQETKDLEMQDNEVQKRVSEVLNGDKLNGVFCVAGGWAGGNAKSKELVKNTALMCKQSLWSSIISASIAAGHLDKGGVVTLPGAEPALDGTPGMIGYGMAKAAIHQLTKSLGKTGSGLPEDATAVCILPITLDTPMNRKWMPDADQTTWTPLEYIASMFLGWLNNEDRPESGSLIKLVTSDSKTTREVVG